MALAKEPSEGKKCSAGTQSRARLDKPTSLLHHHLPRGGLVKNGFIEACRSILLPCASSAEARIR